MKYDPDQTAIEVSEHLLEVTGAALKSRDFAPFRVSFHLPHKVTTFDEVRVFETDEELQKAFYLMCDQMTQLNVTDIIRQCVSSSFKGPQKIESTHVAHLMSKGIRVKDAYPVFSVIEVIDGEWRITSSDYAFEPHSGFERALVHGAIKADPDTPARVLSDNPMTRRLPEYTPKSGEEK